MPKGSIVMKEELTCRASTRAQNHAGDGDRAGARAGRGARGAGASQAPAACASTPHGLLGGGGGGPPPRPCLAREAGSANP